MAKEYDVLLEQAETIRTEVEDDANSAERVGGMFKDIIEKSKDESGRKLAIKDLATSVGYSTETSLTQDAATRLVSEYNVSINHPTAGVDETNRYTLSEAIAKVPAELRNAGVKVSFLDESGSMETWEFQGESWAIGSFSQVGAGKLTELEKFKNIFGIENGTNLSVYFNEDGYYRNGSLKQYGSWKNTGKVSIPNRATAIFVKSFGYEGADIINIFDSKDAFLTGKSFKTYTSESAANSGKQYDYTCILIPSNASTFAISNFNSDNYPVGVLYSTDDNLFDIIDKVKELENEQSTQKVIQDDLLTKQRPLSLTIGYYINNSGELKTYSKVATTELLLIPKKYTIYLDKIFMDKIAGYSLGFLDKDFNLLSTTLSETGNSKVINPDDDFIPDGAYYLCAFARYGQPTENPNYDKPVAYSEEDIFTGITLEQVFLSEKINDKLDKKYFKPLSLTPGYYITNDDGQIKTYSAIAMTELLLIPKKGDTVLDNIFMDKNTKYCIGFLDENFNPLASTLNISGSSTTISPNADYIPIGAKYMCGFARYGQPSSSPQYDRPTAYNLSENIFTGITYDLILRTKNIADNDGNILYGKKWESCGDSFTHGDFSGDTTGDIRFTEGLYSGQLKVYPFFIGRRNNMIIVNEAINGSIMALDKDYVAGTVEDINSRNPFSLQRYKDISSDADYITLWFGLNDQGHTNLGTIEDETNETFYGAWNVVLPYLIEHHPFAKIGIIISSGWLNQQYHDAVKQVAEKWGIPYLDIKGSPQVPMMLGGRLGIDVDERAVTLRDNAFKVTATNAHPNAKAHEYQSTFIENWLRSL